MVLDIFSTIKNRLSSSIHKTKIFVEQFQFKSKIRDNQSVSQKLAYSKHFISCASKYGVDNLFACRGNSLKVQEISIK